MRHVKISELKAHLSEYLRDVAAGETIAVCDRKRPVAHLTPASQPRALRLRPPIRQSDLRSLKGVRPSRPVDVVAMLREERDQR